MGMSKGASAAPFRKRAQPGPGYRRDEGVSPFAIATAALSILSIVLGGGTQAALPGDVALQAMSVVMLALAMRRIAVSGRARVFRGPLVFCVAVVLLSAAQLFPLPFGVWAALPGRAWIMDHYALLGERVTALPLSVTPRATMLSVLCLLPPLAIFWSTASADEKDQKFAVLALIAMAIASVFAGLIQIAQGPHSPLRLYAITNRQEAVGFFANRNHFAALIYVALIFATASLRNAFRAYDAPLRRILDRRRGIRVILWFMAVAILVIGELTARSRAGLALAAIGMLATWFWQDAPRGVGTSRWRLAGAVMVVSIALMASLAPNLLPRSLDRFGSDVSSNVRLTFAQHTMTAALTYMPFGSGLGSFVPVYQAFEQPSEIDTSYANHAHNDFLELWLETGVAGPTLLLGVLGWLCARMWTLRRARVSDRHRGDDSRLQRAAAISLVCLLAHSLVDYPLRTSAMAVVAAMVAGFLIDTRDRPEAQS
jgi:O-antigen ligase